MKYANLGSINAIQAFNETWIDFFFNSAQRLVLLRNVHAFQDSSNSNDRLYTMVKMTIKALYAMQNQPTDFIWIPGLTFDDLFIVYKTKPIT